MTIWYSVPFALIQLLLRGAIEQRNLTSLRWVLFGGEPFPPKHLRSLQLAWPHARFSNVYGPAEVNQCTYYHVPAPAQAEQGSRSTLIENENPIPIGKIWARSEGLVLDGDRAVTRTGETGELLVRSPTMMRGYWGRPDLDAEVFYYREGEEHTPDQRFYRTGDIVRLESNGNYLFIGRKDRQIKLRGHRIEIDDIELALNAHPAVEEVGAYPITRDGQVEAIGASLLLGQEEPTLVGKGASDSVRDAQNAAINEEIAATIKAFASSRLPAYAIPTRLEVLRQLPRTTSGKIDRRALQADAEDQIQNETTE